MRSKFEKRFTEHSGIVQLMEDLGEANTAREGVLMLGGGNPAHIPEVQQFFQERLQRIALDPVECARVIGDYDPPQGNARFIEALAKLFRDEFGWDIGPGNIALSTGSQSAFFMLFNMFSGEYEDGSRKKILLPLTPEYIGYSDVGLSDRCFSARKPVIETLDDHVFKYHVNFDSLTVDADVGAICVSRPTNPTGNVLSDGEIERLRRLARDRAVPLIIDNAYGAPFPNIIFTRANLFWDDQVVLCMSLSKLGLPGVRTGIVVASERIVASIAKMNAIFSLALGSFGPALTQDLLETRDILALSDNVIRPYYRRKAEHAAALFKRELDGVEYYIHKAEGALFLWLWFPDLPITSEELYRRLKRRGVIILPGHYFFPGLEEDWRHRHECIRVSYAMQDTVVEQGIKIIAEEVKKAG